MDLLVVVGICLCVVVLLYCFSRIGLLLYYYFLDFIDWIFKRD